jgi:GPH family glycoside/pentoside/hexuronide:cation symporter
VPSRSFQQIAYGFPALGVLTANVLFAAYIVKYATDVLLVPIGVMGALFALQRIWDAVTDPLAGYWSDRTRTRWGRRRPWLVASIFPLTLFGWMVWAPPIALEGPSLVAWVTVAMLGFSTATTVFMVPHQALGAELTDDAHERTRVFAWREFFAVAGTAIALVGGIGVLTNVDDPRGAALWITLGTSAVIAATVLTSVRFLPERADYQGRGAANPFRAIGDTFRNPHARVVFTMVLILHMGGGASAVLSPFIMHYVIGAEGLTNVVFAAHVTAQFIAIPIWTALSRLRGKKATWLVAIGVGMTGYAMILFVGEGDLVLMAAASMLTGTLHAASVVVGYSIVADVVDYDELRTGERKEGSYFAVYHFLYKSASGVMAMIAGSVLAWSGFVPDQEQTEFVKRSMTGMLGGIPFTCLLIGSMLFSRYKLTTDEHARIRAELDARAES